MKANGINSDRKEWVVHEPGGCLDIRYILYDHDMSRKRYEQLLVWASRDLNLRAVRLLSIVAKRAGKRLNIDACAPVSDIRLFLNNAQASGESEVHGNVPALFACVTNIGRTKDPDYQQDSRNLSEIFKFLLHAKANPYQTVHIADDHGFEARTTPREYLENILEEAISADSQEVQDLIREILKIIDQEDQTFMIGLKDTDIYTTRDEIRFAEDVQGTAEKVTISEATQTPPPRKRRESVFGKITRKLTKGLSRI